MIISKNDFIEGYSILSRGKKIKISSFHEYPNINELERTALKMQANAILCLEYKEEIDYISSSNDRGSTLGFGSMYRSERSVGNTNQVKVYVILGYPAYVIKNGEEIDKSKVPDLKNYNPVKAFFKSFYEKIMNKNRN